METNLIQIHNIHSFCRTCLVTLTKQSNIGAQKFSIHETPDLSNWLQVFTSMEIGSNDIYPEFMCYECYEQIQNFLKFREMCKRSATTLDDILQNVQNQDPKLQETTIKEEETEINNRIEFHKTVKEELSEAGENNIVCEFEAEDKSLITPTFLIQYDITEHQTDTEDNSINKNDLVYQNCDIYNVYNDDNNINSEGRSDNSLDSKKCKTNDTTKQIDSSHLAKIGKKTKGKLKCRICSHGFYKKDCLEIHIRRVHQGLKAFHCNYCNRGFNKSDQLNTHIQKAHANKFSEVKSKQQIKPEKFQCEDCGIISKNLSSFRKHRLKHVTPETYPYQCELCSERFIFRYRYKQHLDKHAGTKNIKESCKEIVENKKPFEYKNCSEIAVDEHTKLLDTKDFLEVGIKTNLAGKETKDSRDATDAQNLNRKTNYTGKDTLKKCKPCSKDKNATPSDSKNSLSHVIKLPISILKKNLKFSKGKFSCTLCTLNFYKQITLDGHIRRDHQGLKPFQCGKCKCEFNKAFRLKVHMNRAHGNKVNEVNEEVICHVDGCGKKFRSKGSFRNHYYNKHTERVNILRTFMCETCGISFKNLITLRKHRYKHGPPEDYPFHCKQCNKGFPAKYKYKQHQDRHAEKEKNR